MSHVTDVGFKAKEEELPALERAAKRRGLTLKRGQRTYKWFNRWVGDFRGIKAAVDQGFDPRTFGQCEHALVLDNDPHAYEIGVVKLQDGSYKLLYDAWGGSGGRPLERACGKDLEGLKRDFTAELATQRAHEQFTQHGFEEVEQEELKDGSLRLRWRRL